MRSFSQTYTEAIAPLLLSLYIYIQQKLKIIFAETMSGVWVFKNGVVRLVDRDLASRQPTKKKVLIHLPTDEVVSSHSSLEQILICCSNHDFVSFLSNLHHHFYSPSLLHVFASIFIFVRLVSPFVYLLSVPFVICVDRCNKGVFLLGLSDIC